MPFHTRTDSEAHMRFKKLAAILIVGWVEALADTTHVRQIIISIPDKKLVLLEDGEVKQIYPIAVGKPSTPSPVGHVSHRQPRGESDLVRSEGRRSPRQSESARDALDGDRLQGLRDSRHECSQVDWQGCIAWLHSHADQGRGSVVQTRRSRRRGAVGGGANRTDCQAAG